MKVSQAISALVVGIIFGLGLALSQMTNPLKVLAFLNLADSWDPSLLLVMGAATSVALIGFRVAKGPSPVFDSSFHLPSAKQIDVRLLGGAAVFGLGWGLAGYCPGPAIAGLASGSTEPLVFVVSMLTGSQIAKRIA